MIKTELVSGEVRSVSQQVFSTLSLSKHTLPLSAQEIKHSLCKVETTTERTGPKRCRLTQSDESSEEKLCCSCLQVTIKAQGGIHIIWASNSEVWGSSMDKSNLLYCLKYK